MKIVVATVVGLVTIFAATHAQAAGECLKIPGPATLSGTLTIAQVRSRSAGAPRRMESVFFLEVREPVCAEPKADADPDDVTAEAAQGVRRVHVFADTDKVQIDLRRAAGRPVTLNGELASAHTQHHRAPLILAVKQVLPPR